MVRMTTSSPPELALTSGNRRRARDEDADASYEGRMRSLEDEVRLSRIEVRQLRLEVRRALRLDGSRRVGEGASMAEALSGSKSTSVASVEEWSESSVSRTVICAPLDDEQIDLGPSSVIAATDATPVTETSDVVKCDDKRRRRSRSRKKRGKNEKKRRKAVSYWSLGAMMVSMTLWKGIVGGSSPFLLLEHMNGTAGQTDAVPNMMEETNMPDDTIDLRASTFTPGELAEQGINDWSYERQRDLRERIAPRERPRNRKQNRRKKKAEIHSNIHGKENPRLGPFGRCDPNPEHCGCPAYYFSDYRGTVSTTVDGTPCQRWDEQSPHEHAHLTYYPDGGLIENYCRNPDNDPNGPWCVTTDPRERYGYCQVPTCGSPTSWPTFSAPPTISPKPTPAPVVPTRSRCPVADKATCGCAVVSQSDYRGTISRSADGKFCARWDGKHGKYNLLNAIEAGLEENYCRNPDMDDKGPWCFGSDDSFRHCSVPECDACECMPPCGEPNLEECPCPNVLQAETCCKEDDAACKCDYLTEACRKGIENDGTTDFCGEAEVACCAGNDDPNCPANFYEQLCYESPSQPLCEVAGDKRCNYERELANGICLCYFATYTATVLGEESEIKKAGGCATDSGQNSRQEAVTLGMLYNETGGRDWFNNAGWLEKDTPQCKWFGVVCDDNDNVVELHLASNNLAGAGVFDYLYLPKLKVLDLSDNKLTGRVGSQVNLFLRNLESVDISKNAFGGQTDMLFPASTWHVNFSSNNFTSVRFKTYNLAHHMLKEIHLANNSIDQNVSEALVNIPPNLEVLELSNNAIGGILPSAFPVLKDLKTLALDGNILQGAIPDLLEASPRLRVLRMSNQRREGGRRGGLTGSIPQTISNLADLRVLDLAGNFLSREIASELGDLPLHTLNLASNVLGGSIPSELGKLKDSVDVLDLTGNQIGGLIPAELIGLKGSSIRLIGNSVMSGPAPLPLCFNSNFDVISDTKLCPVERNALKEFYDGAKGQEWTSSTLWLDNYESHCSWYGVTCDGTNTHTTGLELNSNGLSGTLSKSIVNLTRLTRLNLADNDIKGTIPSEIALLPNLSYLRLSFNAFIGNETSFGSLKNLEVIQLNGNRLSGTIPPLGLEFTDPSSFVTDCGNPSEFEESLACDECTMCCNALDECYPQEETEVQEWGFADYMTFAGFLMGILFAACCAVALISFAYDKYQNRNMTRTLKRQKSILSLDRDKKYAVETIGHDTVYQFLLGTSWVGWVICLATMASQIWMLLVFVDGAEIDLSRDNNDVVYYWMCTRDNAECRDTNDLTGQGWASFAFLMAAHLLADVINGMKMIVFSGKERHGCWFMRLRFFTGGTLTTFVTAFTLYASTIYNAAIATSNTEIIMNSVVILFICDVDELVHDVLTTINPDWVGRMTLIDSGDGDEPSIQTDKWNSVHPYSLHGAVLPESNIETSQNLQTLMREVQEMQKTLDKVMGERRGVSFADDESSQSYETDDESSHSTSSDLLI